MTPLKTNPLLDAATLLVGWTNRSATRDSEKVFTSGEYDGRHAVVWRLRLHPNGGLGFLPDPSSGEPALAVVQESGVGSRATRWYSGDGAPPTGAASPLQPPPALGDFYLDRLTGQVYELSA